MPENTTVPVDADVRTLFVAALLRNGGSSAFLYEELGEAAVASFTGVITVEHEHEGAIFRLVADAPEEGR